MKRKTLMLCAAMLFGLAFSAALASACSLQTRQRDTQPVPIPESSPAEVISPTEVVWEMLGQVDRDRALADLRRLTGEDPICAGPDCYTITDRLTGSEGLRRATDSIAGELIDLGYSVAFWNWSRSGQSDRNVVARKPGVRAPDEEITLIAHLDGVRMNDEERFPAADDNAGGAVDLLETARVLSSQPLSRTVVFLFTTGEEQGTLGARSYLDQLSPSELASIKAAVNVDVIGYDDNHDGVMELWHSDDVPSMAVTQMMSETIKAYRLDLTPRFIAGCD